MLHIKHLNSVFFFFLKNHCSDTSSSATSQYHAQLYSGQKQLQKRHQLQQEQKRQLSLPSQAAKPTSLNYKVLSFDAPNLYHTSLKLTTEIDIRAWWASLVKIFSGEFAAVLSLYQSMLIASC